MAVPINIICKVLVLTKGIFTSGFRIELMNNFPREIHSDYMLATDTYVTTEANTKRVRVRYIPEDRLSKDDICLVREHFSSFPHLYYLTVKKQEAQLKTFSHNFIQMIVNSSTLYER